MWLLVSSSNGLVHSLWFLENREIKSVTTLNPSCRGVETLSELPDILTYFQHALLSCTHMLCIQFSFNLLDILIVSTPLPSYHISYLYHLLTNSIGFFLLYLSSWSVTGIYPCWIWAYLSGASYVFEYPLKRTYDKVSGVVPLKIDSTDIFFQDILRNNISGEKKVFLWFC